MLLSPSSSVRIEISNQFQSYKTKQIQSTVNSLLHEVEVVGRDWRKTMKLSLMVGHWSDQSLLRRWRLREGRRY